MTDERSEDVERFYSLLTHLADRLGGTRTLGTCARQDGWPSHGVYFFYEHGELRDDGSSRVVRVGTHALQPGSRATLWKRLSQHRSNRSGGGNHRGSIFRKHVGSALINRDGLGDAALTAWLGRRKDPTLADQEATIERHVSDHIRAMPFLWLAVPTRSDGTSLRGYLERNCIGLLAGPACAVDKPSDRWLGHHAASAKVRESALWNVNYVAEQHDPVLLDTMEQLVAAM